MSVRKPRYPHRRRGKRPSGYVPPSYFHSDAPPEPDPWPLHNASCRYCRAPLLFSGPPHRHVFLTGLSCTRRRTVRCVRAALACRTHGPNS